MAAKYGEGDSPAAPTTWAMSGACSYGSGQSSTGASTRDGDTGQLTTVRSLIDGKKGKRTRREHVRLHSRPRKPPRGCSRPTPTPRLSAS